MIPKIVDVTQTDRGFYYYVTATNHLVPHQMVCISFKTSTLDVEDPKVDERMRSISYILKNLDKALTAKFQARCQWSTDVPDGHSRATALREVGYQSQTCYLHFEYPLNTFTKGTISLFSSLLKGDRDPHLYVKAIEALEALLPIDQFNDAGIILTPCLYEEINALFPDYRMPISYGRCGIVEGDKSVGVVKLLKLSSADVNIETIALRKIDFPLPFDIVTTIKQPSDLLLREHLNRTRRQEETKSDQKSVEKASARDEALANVDNRGLKYLFLEVHIILKRDNEQDLLKELKTTAQKASTLGDFIVETPIGTAPSYAASLPGGRPHLLHRTIERDDVIPCYIPWNSFGTSSKEPLSKTAVAYHRQDLSLDYHDSSDERLSNGHRNIFALPGRGKSVFLTLQISSIAQEKESHIFLTDVAGSHTNTIKDLGGTVHNINLDSPSPINHFRHLKSKPSETILQILNKSLLDLLLDDGEVKLSTADEYYAYNALVAYAEGAPKNPSVPDFIKFLFPNFDPQETLFPNFPRKEHLLRYSKKGMLKNVFSTNSEEQPTKINYFNIQNISSAQNSGVTKGVVSASLAEFWITAETKPNMEQVHYIVDEAPVVITGNFSSLAHTTTQTRKKNGHLSLVAQKVEQLVVDGNTTLLSSASTSIFFALDDMLDRFKAALKITDLDIAKIGNLSFKAGEYAQCYFRNDAIAHIGLVILAKSEYWRGTSRPSDNALIDSVQSHFPTVPRNVIAQLIAASEYWR